MARNARRVLQGTGESPARPSTPGPGLPTLSHQSAVSTCARWALLSTCLPRPRGPSCLARPRPRRQKLPYLWSTRVVRATSIACSPRTLGRWLPQTPWSSHRRPPVPSPWTPLHSPCPQSPHRSPLLCPSPSIRSPPSRRGVKKGELDVSYMYICHCIEHRVQKTHLPNSSAGRYPKEQRQFVCGCQKQHTVGPTYLLGVRSVNRRPRTSHLSLFKYYGSENI